MNHSDPTIETSFDIVRNEEEIGDFQFITTLDGKTDDFNVFLDKEVLNFTDQSKIGLSRKYKA